MITASEADFYTDPFAGEGVLLSETPGRRNWICQDKHDPKKWHLCSVEWIDPLLEANLQERNETHNQRFGDWRKVASWDTATYWNKILPARLNGDDKYVRKQINASENTKFRTFDRKI